MDIPLVVDEEVGLFLTNVLELAFLPLVSARSEDSAADNADAVPVRFERGPVVVRDRRFVYCDLMETPAR